MKKPSPRLSMIKLQTVENADHLAHAKALFQEYAETRKNDPALEDFHEEIDNDGIFTTSFGFHPQHERSSSPLRVCRVL